jgi:phosphoribosylformylglycinamidine synthase
LGLLNAITDNGAGGLSSSIGEMGEELGVRLDLDKAPLKYPGLMPWEILLSEAQERMSVAVSKENLSKFMNLAKLREVEATVVGEFNGSKAFQLYYNGKIAGELDMEFLHEGVPQMNLIGHFDIPEGHEEDIPKPNHADYSKELHEMLARLNICSKEYFVRRFDTEAQGTSIIKPFTGAQNDGPSDAGVIKPLADKWEGIVISHGICPRFSDIDPYYMVANSIDEAVRNAVCVGADPDYLSGLDNFCWAMGFGEEDEKKYTGMLVRANKALYDYCVGFGVPCISGKDSMKNDYRIGDHKVSVPPTLLYSVMGKIEDIRKAVTMDVKAENDLVYILGVTDLELGGSEYFDKHGKTGVSVPKVQLESAKARYQKLHKAIMSGTIRSAHDLSDGGLAVAAAESSFAGDIGMSLDLRKVPMTDTLKQKARDDYVLYSETPSRFIVTVSPDKQKEFENLMKDTIFAQIGTVKGKSLEIIGLDGNSLLNEPIDGLKKSWQRTLDW